MSMKCPVVPILPDQAFILLSYIRQDRLRSEKTSGEVAWYTRVYPIGLGCCTRPRS